MELYSYEALQPDTFRLLRVPAQPDLPYELIHADIDAAPPYAALSYTWGRPNFSKHIVLGPCILKVTENLYEGLHALRARVSQSGYYLWIDAICIDQQNVKERNAQVSLMKVIYENATLVYVWLGIASDESDLAIRKIREFGHYLGALQQQHENDIYKAVGTLSPEDPTVFGEEGSESFRSWNAIAVLFRRDWWYRAWIIQEATASTRTIFCCGVSSVSWRSMMSTILIADQLSSFPGLESFSSIGSFWRKYISLALSRERNDARRLLLDVMQSFRLSDCGDNRDKIYAKLGLATDVASGDIAVRYDRPICDVYIDLVNWSFARSPSFNRLDFLGCVIRSAEKPSVIQMPEDKLVPSWVPDWRGVVSIRPFGKALKLEDGQYRRVYSVSGHSMAQARILDSNFIAKGLTFSPIVSVSSISKKILASEGDIVEATWAPSNLDDVYHPTGQTIEQAYLHTITADADYHDEIIGCRGNHMDWSFHSKQQEALKTEGEIINRMTSMNR
ncbi:hypothetical protein MMC13_000529 [Lambiella insularis]|nr:hypothetical protein [Lambiella insularis]